MGRSRRRSKSRTAKLAPFPWRAAVSYGFVILVLTGAAVAVGYISLRTAPFLFLALAGAATLRHLGRTPDRSGGLADQK